MKKRPSAAHWPVIPSIALILPSPTVNTLTSRVEMEFDRREGEDGSEQSFASLV